VTDATLPLEETDPGASGEQASLPRPRTRWAGIVWGLVFVALATIGIWASSDPARLDGFAPWLGTLDPGAAIGYGLLTVGGLLLVGGLVGLLRRAQIAASRR